MMLTVWQNNKIVGDFSRYMSFNSLDIMPFFREIKIFKNLCPDKEEIHD